MNGAAPILVVDDDPGLRALLSATLELEGHSVLTAADGSVALGVVEETQPALILLDKAMPHLDGPGFVRELRSRGLSIPIVVISGSEGGPLFAREIAADGFIRKPFQILQLVETVEGLLSRIFFDGRGEGTPQTSH